MNNESSKGIQAYPMAFPPGMPFCKFCGAGNDFIIIDGEHSSHGGKKWVLEPRSIARLCDRRYGVGADGLMVLSPCAGHLAFELDFYNADGSSGMLCGNGARCAIERARLLGLASPGETIRFRFAGHEYQGASLSPAQARLDLDPHYRIDEACTIAVGDASMRGRFVDVGSLHFIIDVGAILDASGRPLFESIDDVPLETLGKAVRNHPEFAPAGVNANFTQMRGGKLYVRTFERGVEGETLSCGTGSVSSALVRWHDEQGLPPIVVVARSGDELLVDWLIEGGVCKGISLCGPAFMSFEGRLCSKEPS